MSQFGSRVALGAAILSLSSLVACSSPGERARLARSQSANLADQTVRHETRVATDSGTQLHGYLTLPDATNGPFPAFLLLPGSGPQKSDMPIPGQLGMAFGFSIPVLKELADLLAERGVASLRVDKRSCSKRFGCPDYPTAKSDISLDDFLADHKSALRTLRSDPRVDQSQVFVLGISQGATLVPYLLRADPSIRGGVMLGAAYRPIDALLYNQSMRLQALLKAVGAPPSKATPAIEAAKAITALRTGDSSANETILGAPMTFWKTWLRYSDEAPAVLQAAAQPVLVIGGGRDWNVGPEELEAWEADFATTVGGPRTTRRIPCLTHALNCVTFGSRPQDIGPSDIGKHVEPSVADMVVDFLRTSLAEPSPAHEAGEHDKT